MAKYTQEQQKIMDQAAKLFGKCSSRLKMFLYYSEKDVFTITKKDFAGHPNIGKTTEFQFFSARAAAFPEMGFFDPREAYKSPEKSMSKSKFLKFISHFGVYRPGNYHVDHDLLGEAFDCFIEKGTIQPVEDYENSPAFNRMMGI